MQEFLDFARTYWPNILNYLGMVIGYFFILLYKFSTRNLNGCLKTTFAENTKSALEFNTKLQKELQQKCDEAIKTCEEYQRKVTYLEETLRCLLGGGDDDE